jgi:hypothetical protein
MKGWFRFAVVIAVVAGGMAAAHAAAPTKAAARCWVSPVGSATVGQATLGQTVQVWGDGLPTKTTLNVFVTDEQGRYGWPMGVASDGTNMMTFVPRTTGASTIEITGPERPNNVKVYATCAMSVSA